MEYMKLENHLRIKRCQVTYLKEAGNIILDGCILDSANLSKNSEKHFMYLGNTDKSHISKTWCIISISFSTNVFYFIMLSFSVQIILTIFISHVLNLNTLPEWVFKF